MNDLLTSIKLHGLSIEHDIDVTKTMLNVSAMLGNDKAVAELKEKYLKCYYPEMMNQAEELKKKVHKQVVLDGDKMRIAASVNEAINPAMVQAISGK